jgi:hypothetical protein
LWHQFEFEPELGLPVNAYSMSKVINEYVTHRWVFHVTAAQTSSDR